MRKPRLNHQDYKNTLRNPGNTRNTRRPKNKYKKTISKTSAGICIYNEHTDD